MPIMGPFDRFNDRAKRVLALSQDEAIRFNHNYIGPEHILLGLVREGEGVAARVLDSMGVTLSQLRMSVEALLKRGDTVQPSDITLSPQTKKLIDFAVDEARKLGHSHVGTEHLLLGLLRVGLEAESPAANVMGSLGLDLQNVREQVVATLANAGAPSSTARPWSQRAAPPGRSGPFDRFDDGAKRVLALAQEEALRLNHNYIGTEHLLAGLIREGAGTGARVLQSLGVEVDKVRTALEFIIGRGDQQTSPNDMTMSPRTKKIIELAIDESRKLGHSHVGTEHLLLGLVREGEGIASGILQSLGVSLETVRHQVIATLGQQGPPRRARRDPRFDKYYDAQGKKRDWYCEDVLSGKMTVEVIHQDDRVMAFHHPDPDAAVHVVIIPKAHVAGLLAPEATDPELMRSVMMAVQEVARIMGLKSRGFFVRSNAATPDVTPHMHWHVMGPGIAPLDQKTP